MEENCIFCKIVKGEIPSYKIYEDEKFLAFLDISQFTEGHTLIIPKEHFHFVWDVPNVGEYIDFAKKVGNHYRDLGYEYVDTMTFGRAVPHAHIHLIPTDTNSKEYFDVISGLDKFIEDSSRRLTREKGEQLAAKLKL